MGWSPAGRSPGIKRKVETLAYVRRAPYCDTGHKEALCPVSRLHFFLAVTSSRLPFLRFGNTAS